MNGSLDRRALIRGGTTFVAITVAALGILMAVTTSQETWTVLREVSLGFLLLAAGCAVLDLLISGFRYFVFVREASPGAPFSLPMTADLAARFAGAVTPSQTGGGPLQIWMLARGGVGVGDTLSLLGINLLSTIVLFAIGGAASLWFLGSDVGGTLVHGMLIYGLVLFGAAITLLLLALLRPEVIEAALRRVAGWLERRRGRVASLLYTGINWLTGLSGRYGAACRHFLVEKPWLMLYSLVLTVVLYLNKFILAYFLVLGLGVEAAFIDVLAIQMLLTCVTYVAPSPGASGIAELATAVLMSSILEQHLLGLFTIASRFFLVYMPAGLGCLILLNILRPRAPAIVRTPAHATHPETQGALQ